MTNDDVIPHHSTNTRLTTNNNDVTGMNMTTTETSPSWRHSSGSECELVNMQSSSSTSSTSPLVEEEEEARRKDVEEEEETDEEGLTRKGSGVWLYNSNKM